MSNTIHKRQINEWYINHSQDIYQYVLYLLQNDDIAKDILQETFLKAYQNIKQFKEENAKGWLIKIARNTSLDYLRKKHPINYIMDTIPNNNQTPEQVVNTNESTNELYQALGKLKRSYRDVIILRKIKDFTVSETAIILNWNEAKVRTTLSRAMSALKKQLETEGYQHEVF